MLYFARYLAGEDIKEDLRTALCGVFAHNRASHDDRGEDFNDRVRFLADERNLFAVFEIDDGNDDDDEEEEEVIRRTEAWFREAPGSLLRPGGHAVRPRGAGVGLPRRRRAVAVRPGTVDFTASHVFFEGWAPYLGS